MIDPLPTNRKKAEKLEKRIAEAESKIANAKDEKAKEKLARSKDALVKKLDALKDKEIKRLDKQRAAGKLTDVYYQRRTSDVKDNSYSLKRDLYTDAARIDKNDFIAAELNNGTPRDVAIQKYAKIEEKNIIQARNVVARVKNGKEEVKLDLAKADPLKAEAEKQESSREEKGKENEKATVVKNLDLSDKLKKPTTREYTREREPDAPEHEKKKEIDEQII